MFADNRFSKQSAKGAGNEEGMSASGTDSEFCWRMRVCPIRFEDFCQLQNVFKMLIGASITLDFRMSSALLTKMPQIWQRSPHDADLPWVPSKERAFAKHQTAATLGMLEVVVRDSMLVPCVHCIQQANFSRKGRLRFELKRLSKEEAQDLLEKKSTTEKEADISSEDLLVNFSVRLEPAFTPALEHPSGHQDIEEDNYMFVKKIPDMMPDHVLQAIFPTEMVERRTGADDTGTAIFNVKNSLGAQVYMELYDGILVNSKCLELSTTLCTLQDAKKKRAQMQVDRAEANAIAMEGQPPAAVNTDQGQTRKRTHEMSAYSAGCGGARRTTHRGTGETFRPGPRAIIRPGPRGAVQRGARGTIHRGTAGMSHREARGTTHGLAKGGTHGGARGTFKQRKQWSSSYL